MSTGDSGTDGSSTSSTPPETIRVSVDVVIT